MKWNICFFVVVNLIHVPAVSILKKIHSLNPNYTSLADLLVIQSNPRSFSAIRNQKYKVQCYLVDIFPKALT